MNNVELKYNQALDYIYSFVDYSRTHHDQLSSADFDLRRMEEFVRRLGSPHLRYPTVHIAGSKGKGSVSALAASALQAAGYRVGLYTSPHLKDFEERIQVDGRPISRQRLVELVDEIRPVIDSLAYPTTFEIMTALGFLQFSREEVDLAVIEVGLGGRLDSTNVVSPAVTVITALYLDHITILGDTIEEIAVEKGGIIKPGVPVVVAPQANTTAVRELRRIALEQRSPFHLVNEEYLWEDLQISLEGQRFLVTPKAEDQGGQPLILEIPLLGEYQVQNALTAFSALQQLRPQGFEIADRAIFDGFRNVHWPGRFEILRRDPAVIVDSAHNPASCRLLMETVEGFFPDQPVVMVFGISEDKQLEGMLDEILPRVAFVITCQADHPRAMNAGKLAEVIQSRGKSVRAVPDVGEALQEALSAADKEGVVVVAGSIFVAATARIAWEEKNLG